MLLRTVFISLALLGTATTAGCAHAQPSVTSAIVGRAPVSFPAYKTVRNLDDYATADAYAAAVADRSFVMERLTYQSDGLEVYAYLYRPARLPRGRVLPVIIFNRGSWTWTAFHAELVTMANRLARQGYLVVAPMYRGSGGAPGRDELGGVDLDDLFNLVPVVKDLGYADLDQLYLYGESRGGMMTYQALRDGFPARAAATVGGFADLAAMLKTPRWAQAGAQIWPDLDTNSEAIIRRRSVVLWPEKIGKPLLIMHGAQDEAVDVSQALHLAELLHENKKPFELVVMEGEGHVLAGRTIERDMLAIRWFRKYSGSAVGAGIQ